jgi:hypothetical protein
VYRNNADIVALLLSFGARINAFNNLEQVRGGIFRARMLTSMSRRR